MLEFLETITKDPDLHALWRAFLNESNEDDQRRSLLVFTDRLEEVGWSVEANFIRSEIERPSYDITPRLRMPKVVDYAAGIPRSRVSITEDTLRALEIKNVGLFALSRGTHICDITYRHGLPHTLSFFASDLFCVLPFLQSFLHLLPIREISFDIRSLVVSSDTNNIPSSSGNTRYFVFRVPVVQRNAVQWEWDSPLQLAAASARFTGSYTVCPLPTDLPVSGIHNLPQLVNYLARQMAHWLSAAFATNVRDRMLPFHSASYSASAAESSLLLDEAARFRKDLNLLDR